MEERKYTLCFLGFLSFFGFSGLNGNPYNLLWFSFAGYFSYFWWAKLGQIDNESLKKNKDFQVVYKNGKSYANRYLVLYIRENGMDKNRLGISVSKKVGNSVVRHHLTRLIRESYRLQEEHFQCGFDLVVIARAGAKERSYHDIESALIHLGKLHNIYA